MRTGDLCKIDSDGFHFIVGREKDLIITAGKSSDYNATVIINDHAITPIIIDYAITAIITSHAVTAIITTVPSPQSFPTMP